MSQPTGPTGRTIARRSLRQKLPLLVSALTGGALLIAVSLSYVEVRSSARAAAEARVEAVAVQLAELFTPGLETRLELEEELSEAPSISRALRAGAIDSVRVDSLLSELRGGSDGDLPVILIASDGSPIFSTGTPVAPPDPFQDPPLDSVPHDGFFRQVGERMLYWRTFPVRSADGEMLGWIAQRRRLGSPETGEVIESLVGSNVRISLGQVSDSVWVDLGGNPVARGPDTVGAGEAFTYDAGGDQGVVLAMTAPLESSPWVLLVKMPMAEVMARPRSFLSRAVVAGIALLLATTAIAWLASRRLTNPLQDMAHAAGRIAAGDYDRRVHVRGDDELALLANAFNTMAEQVARADEALRLQLDEAKALASRLEAANVEAESAREEAQAASRAKSEFLATMSHEIRTPINAVIGYTSLLEEGIPDPPTERQRDYLKRIERSSRLLISLVNDVLDLSRIESGRLHLDIGIGSAEEAVLSAVAALEPEANRKGIRLDHRCEPGAAFRGDPQRVQQILLNLLSNAVKFTKEGRVEVSCRLVREGPPGAARHAPRWLRIDVEDTGIGVEADQLGHIFQPFVQANVGFTREHGGAGLGLPISRRLALMMSGEITVESVPGEGSRFTLWLEGQAEEARAAATA